MEIKSTFTVDDKTFDTEQEAMDYAHFLERKAVVKKLIVEVFPDDSHSHLCGGYVTAAIATQIVKHPEIFRKALDIVDGK